MSTIGNSWFENDKKGMAAWAGRDGYAFVSKELYQNGVDEDGVTKIAATITWESGVGYVRFEDDAPEGFHDLSHAWTLFAKSRKRGDPEKRGRFNLGEKLVLCLCKKAVITTTTGRVVFDEKGRRRTSTKTDAGSVIECWIPMLKRDALEVIDAAQAVLVPKGIDYTVNGDWIKPQKVIATLEAKALLTEIESDDGLSMKKTKRNTVLRLYAVQKDENPYLHEMGIPVVALEEGDRWHVDIAQKVPLTLDRSNVPPSFLKRVRTIVLNGMHEKLREEDTTKTCIKSATEDPEITKEAMTSYMDTRFGKDRVSYDPSDLEANKRAEAEGHTVVKGGDMDRAAWENARNFDLVIPAGQVFPSAKIVFSPDGKDISYPKAKWTDAMWRIKAHAERLGSDLLDCKITADFVMDPQGSVRAFFGQRRLSFNVGKLGKKWFKRNDSALSVELNELIIHEFGHYYESDHLSSNYHAACCKLGAKLAKLAWEIPDILDDATYQDVQEVKTV